MRRVIELFVLVALAAGLASAGSVSALFQGTFNEDNQVELFSLTADGSTDVTIQSFGYAGGMFGSTTIAAGGFAPSFFLFDDTGMEVVFDSGGHCPVVTTTDPVTGNCDDPYLLEPLLTTGTYTLALVENDNEPIGSFLSDGFVQDGNPDFTCAEFGQTGNFCDVTTATGTARDGDWALAIGGVTAVSDLSSSAPEPATLALFLSGSAVAALFYRRRLNSN